jgi:hypothetical protein
MQTTIESVMCFRISCAASSVSVSSQVQVRHMLLLELLNFELDCYQIVIKSLEQRIYECVLISRYMPLNP